MPFENYVILVAIAAVFYALIARIVQNKLVDRKEMKAIQEESKQLSKEFKEAKESGNQARMDAAMKKQMEFFPKMNKVMIGQFKPMIVIIVILFAFNWTISAIDPSVQDDLMLVLTDDGKGCDTQAADGEFSGCLEMNSTEYGKWVVTAIAFSDGAEIGKNSTFFLYNIDKTTDEFLEQPTGEPLEVSTDNMVYYPGDQVKITVRPPSRTTSVKSTVNMGTAFYVDLPFTIPILNVQRIQQPYWWFIFIAIISGVFISFIMGRMQKAGLIS